MSNETPSLPEDFKDVMNIMQSPVEPPGQPVNTEIPREMAEAVFGSVPNPDGVDVPPKAKEPPPKEEGSDAKHADSILEAWRARLTDDLQDIEVTELDKSLYLKAVLNDVEFEINIPLAGVDFRVRTASHYENRIVWMADAYLQTKAEDTLPYLVRTEVVQHMYVNLHVRQIGDRPFSELTLDPKDGDTANVEKLANSTIALVAKCSPHKMEAALLALRVHDKKVAILNSKLRDGDFWKTPGAVA